MTTRCSRKSLLYRVTHTYIISRTLLGFAVVLYSPKDVSFIKHPVVVTVCFVTIPHRRKQAEKDNDAQYVLTKKPRRDQFNGNQGLYSWNMFPEVTTAQIFLKTLFLMNHSHLTLTVIIIPTTFFSEQRNMLLTTSHFSKYFNVESETADNRFWNVV
jgi:hypothetical protein